MFADRHAYSVQRCTPVSSASRKDEMKLLVLLFAMGICAQAQTARQLIGGSDSLTPGCVVQVAGSWNERQLSAANIFVPGTEVGGSL